MNLKQIDQENILIVNGINFLGKNLISKLVENNIKVTVAQKNIIGEDINEFENKKNISILDYNIYTQSYAMNAKYSSVIYLSIYENGNNSSLIDSLNSFKKILQKALSNDSFFILVTTLNSTNEENKIDYKESLKILINEYIVKGLKGIVLNIGEIYGPGMNIEAPTPLAKVIKQSFENKEINISKERLFKHYVYIDDCTDGIFTALIEKKEGEYNIASPTDISIQSIALRVAELVDKRINYDLNDVAHDDHLKDLSNPLPNWENKISIEKGLEKTFEWIFKNKELKNKNIPTFNPISSDDIKKLPIRNYNAPINDPSIEEATNIRNIHSNKINLGNINELRKNYDQVEKPNQYSQKEEPIINRRSNKIFIFGILLFIAIYIFIINPILIVGIQGLYIYTSLKNYELSKSEAIYNSAVDINSNISFISWAFYITKQESSLNKMTTFTNSLISFSSGQAMYYKQINLYNKFALDLSNQNNTVSEDLNSILNTKDFETTKELIYSSENNLTEIEKVFKGINLTNSIETQKADVLKMKVRFEVTPKIFNGTKNYLIVVTKGNLFSTNDILKTYSIEIKDGLIKKIETLDNPKSLPVIKNISNYALEVESNYTSPFSGLIMITQDSLASILNNDELNSDAKINLTTILGNKEILNEGIINGTIQVYFNNITLSQNDIINLLD